MSHKPKILYLGNKVYSYKKVRSVLENLEPLLAEFCTIRTASDQKNKFLRFLDMYISFFKYGLRSDKIIIDVYSTYAFYFAFLMGSLAILFKKPLVLFLHGGNLPKRYLKSPILVGWLFKKANVLIAPSSYLKFFFDKFGYNVKVIHNFIHIHEYPFKERNDIRPRVLCIRGFGKPYNPLMTLEAIRMLSDEFPLMEVLMLGNEDDYYYNDVTQFVSIHNLSHIVQVKPKVTRQEWIELSEYYDIMVSNPDIDNTPVSILEGMALGMCVISTKVGGVPYLVSEKECMLIESDNSNGLARAILELIQNSDLAHELSKNGRKRAEEFDWERIKPKWKEILLNA